MSDMSSSLESSLVKLNNAVDNKEPFDTIDGIVDDEVTPQIQSIFKIKLAEEEEEEEKKKRKEEKKKKEEE